MDAKKREHMERLLLIPLLLVFVVVIVNFVRQMGGPQGRKTPAAVVHQAPAVELTEPLMPVSPLQQALTRRPEASGEGNAAGVMKPQSRDGAAAARVYAAAERRDPLQSLLPRPVLAPAQEFGAGLSAPYVEQASARPNLAIQGIWWGVGPAGAIINGDVYRVGDTVEGMTVRAIGPNGVTVEFQGQTVDVTMEQTASGQMSGQAASHMTADWRR